MRRRKEQPFEIIALIVAERISPAARPKMTLESFVDCEREDEPRWRIISDSRCLALAFLDSREKSLGKQLYGKRERKSGLEEEEKRGKAIGKRGAGKKEDEEKERSRRKL